MTPRRASGRGSGETLGSTFLGDLLAGPRPRGATEMLADAYAREARLARQLQLHAEHFGRYPDKRARLLELAARADGYARRLAAALDRPGAAPPPAIPRPHDGRTNWERLKVEQEGREGIFHDVAEGLPGLLYARKIQQRAKAVGFEYPDLAGALADLADELRELEEQPSGDELGDVLFAAVNVARRLEVDPELEVRRASQRFRRRVEVAEELAAETGENWSEMPLERQDAYFDQAKERE